MTIDLPSQAFPAEGTTLPPPRPFGETHTLTLPLARPISSQSEMVNGSAMAATSCQQPLRVAVVPASPASLTITF